MHGAPDLALIRRYEDELGSPSLWAGLLADRRLFFGRYCKFRQDYRPRYSERQMLGALTEALIRVERLFENARPNLILGFAPVTLHEYIALRLAEARGIPFLLLRSTKIDNYVSLNDRLFGLSRHVEARLDTGARRLHGGERCRSLRCPGPASTARSTRACTGPHTHDAPSSRPAQCVRWPRR